MGQLALGGVAELRKYLPYRETSRLAPHDTTDKTAPIPRRTPPLPLSFSHAMNIPNSSTAPAAGEYAGGSYRAPPPRRLRAWAD